MTRAVVRAGLRLLLATGVVLAVASLPDEDPPDAVVVEEAPVHPAPAVTAPKDPPSPTLSSSGPLLLPAAHGDGDSWRDTSGQEYRLGLVNAPEQDECFGSEATAARRALVADGFRAEVYARDRYGRGVSVVTTAAGQNLNVDLARRGYVDDRYLDEFRSENPALAAELDGAFEEARTAGRGLWGACQTPERTAPPPASEDAVRDGCHPDYVTCLPVVGDGSGNGRGNDLDCGDLPGAAQARQPGVDPYRLDGDGDGLGCDA